MITRRFRQIMDVELARGKITDRPWAMTIATLARRAVTGQLTIVADGKRYAIAFERGAIVAARSPMIADSVARVALTTRLVTPALVQDLQRRPASPTRDDVDLLAELALLSPAQIYRLRRDTIVRSAARTFALEAGDYIFEDTSCLPARGCEVDIRAVVYHGIRMHLSESRLASELRQLGGARFVLEPQATDEIHQFGFCDGEWPVLAALRDQMSLPELEARFRHDVDPRTMQAAIYALVACGTARVVAPARTPTPMNLPRTKTNPELAAEAVERAERALKAEQVETAVLELKKAHELVPNDVDTSALLGWALFCAASDKLAVARETKQLLERALHKSTKPHQARFYLGRVERMLGRDREALHHFHAVLLMQPNHRDASAEVRVLEARLRHHAN